MGFVTPRAFAFQLSRYAQLATGLDMDGQCDEKRPLGEVGVLRRVEKSNILPADRCFLYIDYEESSIHWLLSVQ